MNLIKTGSDFIKAIGDKRKPRLRGIICVKQLTAQGNELCRSTIGKTYSFYKGNVYNVWIMGIFPAHVMVSLIGDKTGQVYELSNKVFPDYVMQKNITMTDDYTLTRTIKGELHLIDTDYLRLDYAQKLRDPSLECVAKRLMHSNIYDETASLAHVGWAYMKGTKMLDFFSLDEENFLDKKEISSLYLNGLKERELMEEKKIISYIVPGLAFKQKFSISFESGQIRYNL